MYILGISAFYHDAAACLLKDGEIIAAAQEERFTRVKHDASFPIKSIQWCLNYAGITFDSVDKVGFYEKPYLKFERILKTAGRFFPKGFEVFDHALGAWWHSKLWTPDIVVRNLLALSPSRGTSCRWDRALHFSEHHQAHAASAFYPSPFREAAVLVLDGVGEWSTSTLAKGSMDRLGVPRIELLSEIRYPDSLGMLYSAFTAYLGFKVNSGEYKVMGLAPYGTPKHAERIRDHLIELKPDGSFRLNYDYFSFPYDYAMVSEAFCRLFGMPQRKAEAALEPDHFDIAASVQAVLEEAVLRIAGHLHSVSGSSRLCLAGGVALNCVANGRLHREGPYSDIWVQPAATDSGGAVGIALYIWHDVLRQRRALQHVAAPHQTGDAMKGALLGPEYTNDEIKEAFERHQLPYEETDFDTLCEEVAALLAEGKVVGWFQGRMEFGPRALGARSILGDPRSADMQRVLNLKVKYRESFRPFAPSVLRDKVAEWFDLQGKDGSALGGPQSGYDSPYMLLVAPVAERRKVRVPDDYDQRVGLAKLNTVRSVVPSCTHVDYSARIQTVAAADNPKFHALIEAFERRTGVPLLVNTSFNVRGEPIVCTPDDAIRCFLGTGMDALAMGDFVVHKAGVAGRAKSDYQSAFALD